MLYRYEIRHYQSNVNDFQEKAAYRDELRDKEHEVNRSYAIENCRQEIICDFPKCIRLERSPLKNGMPEATILANGARKKSFFVPDFHQLGVFLIVSEAFIDLMKEFNITQYQADPIDIVNKKREKVNNSKMYYMNYLLGVTIEPDGSRLPAFPADNDWVQDPVRGLSVDKTNGTEIPLAEEFLAGPAERGIIATIKSNEQVRRHLELMPMFTVHNRILPRGFSVYFNEEFFRAMQQRGLRYFREVVHPRRSDRENINHV